MPSRRLVALPLLVFAANAASAQESATCRAGPQFADDAPFALAMVIGEEPASFRRDAQRCEGYRQACDPVAHAFPGETVIISKVLRGLACAMSPHDEISGWINTRHLALYRIETAPPVEAWVGAWASDHGRQLEFFGRFGELYARGRSGRTSGAERSAAPDGQIDGSVSVAGYGGKYRSVRCEASFTLLGDFLIASDNGKCGGAANGFSAVYRRVLE